MAIKNDGGSAFPSHGSMEEVVCSGMSLRDYFATTLKLDDIQVYLAEGIMGSQCPVRNDETQAREIINWWTEAEAKYRYLQADAMLKERYK